MKNISTRLCNIGKDTLVTIMYGELNTDNIQALDSFIIPKNVNENQEEIFDIVEAYFQTNVERYERLFE